MQTTVTFQPNEFVQAVADLYKDVQQNPDKYKVVYYLKTETISDRQVTSASILRPSEDPERWTDEMIQEGVQSARNYVNEYPDAVFNFIYLEYRKTSVHIEHENDYTRKIDKAIAESYQKYPNRD